MKEITSRIKKIRIAKSISQLEMAELLNISQSAYAKIERGRTRLDVERLIEICHILSVEPSEMVELEQADLPASFAEAQHQDFQMIIKQLKSEIAFLRKILSDK